MPIGSVPTVIVIMSNSAPQNNNAKLTLTDQYHNQ